jgi:hypothetical protein
MPSSLNSYGDAFTGPQQRRQAEAGDALKYQLLMRLHRVLSLTHSLSGLVDPALRSPAFRHSVRRGTRR